MSERTANVVRAAFEWSVARRRVEAMAADPEPGVQERAEAAGALMRCERELLAAVDLLDEVT